MLHLHLGEEHDFIPAVVHPGRHLLFHRRRLLALEPGPDAPRRPFEGMHTHRATRSALLGPCRRAVARPSAYDLAAA
ncbi:hypothetical protein G6F57_023798 [Rhizopus arrhizus]|nr:hypothetical protein G6F65_022459 [Rhizopus arrhizus]KAG1415799.1 hypothetical protein G6F57_023798 [Rhizopus arrhizus]